MYYVPYMDPYFGQMVPAPVQPEYMARTHQEEGQQVEAAILAGIEREASAIDLYRRLVSLAPNQTQRNAILHTLENKTNQLQQFQHLYVTLTGRAPDYQIEQETFHSFREGLQKANQAEAEGQEDYQKACLLTQHPLVRDVFVRACTAETDYADRFRPYHEQALKDYGSAPFVVDIEEATTQNNTFRTALWTGDHLQLTVMSIEAGDDIGLEVHPDHDQFLRVEAGQGFVQMGERQDQLDFEAEVYADYAIFVPAGSWHNLTNTGYSPLKLYTIYAPPEHPYGTVHETKAIAMAAEENHHY
ncbi:cupin domain-containing protein [Salsuginibacillus kocurii]|uniref:cupin domain-containing protein n=1 Tax=Salsuginibacillus kocurii TaxID=427078 RepID=UPI00036330E0|nr:cupin domain-containing protein [Salsuginibacillus kocurii]